MNRLYAATTDGTTWKTDADGQELDRPLSESCVLEFLCRLNAGRINPIAPVGIKIWTNGDNSCFLLEGVWGLYRNRLLMVISERPLPPETLDTLMNGFAGDEQAPPDAGSHNYLDR